MKKAYTLVELIMTIVIIGLIIIPIASGYKQIVATSAQNSKISKGVNISELEFSIINNTSYTDPALANGYNNLTSNYEGSGMDLRREVSYLAGTDATAQSIKQITVTIYAGGTSSVVLKTTTYRTKNVIYAP